MATVIGLWYDGSSSCVIQSNIQLQVKGDRLDLLSFYNRQVRKRNQKSTATFCGSAQSSTLFRFRSEAEPKINNHLRSRIVA
jgi:hypothetical protein